MSFVSIAANNRRDIIPFLDAARESLLGNSTTVVLQISKPDFCNSCGLNDSRMEYRRAYVFGEGKDAGYDMPTVSYTFCTDCLGYFEGSRYLLQ